jgi:hypothetical protein
MERLGASLPGCVLSVTTQRQDPSRSCQGDCRCQPKGKRDTTGLRCQSKQHRPSPHSKIKKYTCRAGGGATFTWTHGDHRREEAERGWDPFQYINRIRPLVAAIPDRRFLMPAAAPAAIRESAVAPYQAALKPAVLTNVSPSGGPNARPR